MHGATALPQIRLQVPGRHNVGNALAVIALCRAMDIPWEQTVAGLDAFDGADRRFQYKGHFQEAVVIDDYAHHPTEIAASLDRSAKLSPTSGSSCVFQPHTYTRTKAFLKDFARALSAADIVVLADIYAAREDRYSVTFPPETCSGS